MEDPADQSERDPEEDIQGDHRDHDPDHVGDGGRDLLGDPADQSRAFTLGVVDDRLGIDVQQVNQPTHHARQFLFQGFPGHLPGAPADRLGERFFDPVGDSAEEESLADHPPDGFGEQDRADQRDDAFEKSREKDADKAEFEPEDHPEKQSGEKNAVRYNVAPSHRVMFSFLFRVHARGKQAHGAMPRVLAVYSISRSAWSVKVTSA